MLYCEHKIIPESISRVLGTLFADFVEGDGLIKPKKSKYDAFI